MIEDADGSSRRFVRTFLVVFVIGMIASSALALLVDPLQTFGTGVVPGILTNEREEKPDAFLRLSPPPQAIVLGSSRVYKVRPDCVQELTGYRAYNFGFGFAKLEDFLAVWRFAKAEGHAPIKELIIGVDIETFDEEEADQRLLSSQRLRPYVTGFGSISFGTATKALFGWQAFRYAITSLWHDVRGDRPPSIARINPDGTITYLEWEAQIKAGTFDPVPNITRVAKKLELRSRSRRFPQLSPPRVALFRELVKSAHADGVAIDVFIPPVHPAIAAAHDAGPIGARMKDLEHMLVELNDEGLIHYVSMDDFHGDLNGWFDGNHMTEPTTTRVLLKLFGRAHGCGM